MKKILLGIWGLGVIVAPVTLTIACGSNTNEESQYIANSKKHSASF